MQIEIRNGTVEHSPEEHHQRLWALFILRRLHGAAIHLDTRVLLSTQCPRDEFEAFEHIFHALHQFLRVSLHPDRIFG